MSDQQNNLPFSNRELEKASELVQESLLRSLPEETEPPHLFSDAFEEKMDRLFAKEKARRAQLRVLRNIAAVLGVVLTAATIWFATDVDAWADLQRWIRHISGNDVIYEYSGASPTESLPYYDVTWLPEGYVFSFVLDDPPGIARRIAYENPGEDILFLTYCFMSEGHETTVTGDGPLDSESVTVAGMEGDLYYSEGRGSNVLSWFNVEAGISFGLQTNLERDLMFKIAESVQRTERQSEFTKN